MFCYVQKKNAVRVVNPELENLPVEHDLSEEEVDILLNFGRGKHHKAFDLSNSKHKAKFYTLIQESENYSRIPVPTFRRKDKSANPNIPFFPDPFGAGVTEFLAWSLFYVPSEKAYRYFRILIAPSRLKGAGNGAYTLDPIPKGARAIYKGIAKRSCDTNSYYSWTVKTFSSSGRQNSEDKSLFFIDAEDVKHSNWTRFANCAPKNSGNNFDPRQHFGTFFYEANRNIKAKEELMIDYGDRYRNEYLGISESEYYDDFSDPDGESDTSSVSSFSSDE